ncbi:MAG: PQQ-dependent sugar dehydrogenase [Cyanobacteria bacterium J06592_8]
MELFSESSLNLVFVDPSISNYDELATSSTMQGFETFVLDANQDGIEQVTQILTQRDNVDSIHIISHGSLGSLELGDRSINSGNLDKYQDLLTNWSNHLSEDADILLYGCNVGQDGSFVDELSNLTGADIAASDDLTGNSALGGDWDLEVQTGEIEASLALDAETQLSFEDILANDWIVDTDPNFSNELLITGLNQPIDMAQLPSGELLILEKDGNIFITDPEASEPTATPYMTISDINSESERGLISITLDPDFETNNHFYVYYSKESIEKFRISRFTHNGDSADLSSEFVVWENPAQYRGNAHYGGGLDFGPDGKLYLTTAEEFDRDQATDLTRAGGKILRINKDGSIPEDNPFADGPGGNLDEIWAYGLRNPWRAFWDLETERFFINEVGGNDPETAQEDIHLGEAGANYGWPLYEGISNDPAISDPLFTYDHSESPLGAAAVAAGFVYRGNGLPSQYDGVYFFADYAQKWIRYLDFDANGDVIDADPSTPDVIDAFNFNEDAGRVVSLEQGQNGDIYYLDILKGRNIGGQLRKISYNNTNNQAPIIDQATANQTSGLGPLTVNFSSGATDPENDPLTYTWNFGDGNQATGANVTHTFNTNGMYDVSLTVSDGNSDVSLEPTIEVVVGAAPEGSIDGPTDGDFFRAGDTINLFGSGTDSDGVLGEPNYEWSFVLLHRGAIHPRFEPITGTTGSIVVPTQDSLDFSGDTGYEITLEVTDSDGLTDIEQIVIYPEKSDLTFNSDVPGGVTFTIDDVPKPGPFVYDSAINWEHSVTAPETVTANGFIYSFDGWSDGVETAARSLVVPETDQTYTASYVITGESANPPITDGLVLQLDASNGVTTNGSGAVLGWTDLSGAGNDLNSVGGDPTVITDALNGYNVINFDGSEDKLERLGGITLPDGNEDRSVFMVAEYNSSGDGGFSYGRGSRDRTFGLMVGSDGDLKTKAWGRSGDADSNVDGTGEGFLSQSVILDNSTMDHYKDGALIDSQTHTYVTALDQIVLGADIDSRPYVDMNVAEVLVFDRALSETERQQIENYLQEKYLGSTFVPNGQPNAGGDTFEVNSGSTSNILDVLGNDSDPDGDDLVLMSVNSVTNGSVEINATEDALLYTPNIGFTGTETFNYELSDGNGGTAQGAVTVNVVAASGQPNTENDSFAIDEDSSNNVLDVLLNDSDPDNDPLSITSVGATDNGGVVTINGTSDGLLYTPATNFVGTETFTYTVSDGNGGVNAATVTINVNNLNDDPVAVNDTFSIALNSSNNALNVLANDTDADVSDTFTITNVSAGSNGGTISINGSNDGLIYAPAPDFIGSETFNYTITDSSGSTSTAQVSVDVAELSSPPVSNNLVLQLDGSSATTDGSGIVTGWTDLSGTGNDLTSIGGDPTLVTNALNGHNVIRLDGDGDKLERLVNVNLPSGNADRAVFMVVQYNGTGDGGFSYGQGSRDRTFGVMVGKDGDLRVKAWGNSGDADSNVDGTGQGWLSQSVVLADSTMEHYKDGTLIDSQTHTYNTTLNQIVIGADIDSSPFVDMEVAEILVYDGALSDAERQQVETYLQQKYFGA